MEFSTVNISATSRAPFELSEPLDRDHDKRNDDAWLSARLVDPSTEFIPLWQQQNLLTVEPVAAARPGPDAVADIIPRAESVIYLGSHEGRACFALGLSKDENAPFTGLGKWSNIRMVSELLTPDDWAVLGYARAMVYWHERHRFCGVCGSATVSVLGGYVRRCTNTACAIEHYPRTDPCIIVLVYSGERCLLGRQGSWPAGRYSTLAGFIEPGENTERAVAREVYEEAGVRVREVRYFGSQPWPFPASLMVGFHAEASSEDIHLHDGELADARWFTRQELREALDSSKVGLPMRAAISYSLIAAWFNMAPVGGEL
jgi:NAD+ diphosphatase